MSFASTALNFVMTAGAVAFPEAAPFIAIAQRALPIIEAGVPLIKAAIADGPNAYAAAKAQAPDLFNALQTFANAAKAQLTGNADAVASDHETAAFAAHHVGIDPPGWTHDATERWWLKASGE